MIRFPGIASFTVLITKSNNLATIAESAILQLIPIFIYYVYRPPTQTFSNSHLPNHWYITKLFYASVTCMANFIITHRGQSPYMFSGDVTSG